MPKHAVFLVGATGETGSSILEALVEDGCFVSCFSMYPKQSGSTIFPPSIADQIPLIDAAVLAGVKRFLSCDWGTPAARSGIMSGRDLKEEVHDHIFRQKIRVYDCGCGVLL
jgi:hypothetical protein